MRKVGALLLGLVLSAVALAQSGGGVEGTGKVWGPGVDCAHVWGPPCTSVTSLYAITTEAGTPIGTEANVIIVTEAAP
jgi:hypothetical protein